MLQQLVPCHKVRIHIIVRGGDRYHGAGSDDRLPHAAVREPHADQARQEVIGACPRLVRVGDQFGTGECTGVARGRIELPTPRFSAACSTN